MFQDKKAAEEYDKMLELAENISVLLEKNISGLSAEHSEAVGLLLAQRRELMVKACKGKPEALLEEMPAAADLPAGAPDKAPQEESKVTAISAQK